MSSRWLAAFVIACVVDVGVLCVAAAGKPGAPPTVRTETTGGLAVTPISVPEGTLRVYLPADVAAGDTISGTVVAEPAGGSDAQRAANETVLNGYVVDVGANKAQVARRAFTFVVPAAATSTLLVVRRGNGSIAGRTGVPVRAQQNPSAGQALPNDFKFPQYAAAGQPFTIAGPFSGDFAHGTLAVGGRPAERIAESPRMLVATAPANAVGPTTMQLTESGVTAAAPCNVITLGLSASSTRLAKGERATVHVAIAGLNGIRQPVYVRLVNATPAVVTLAGGQTQVLTVPPGNVRPDGTFVTDREVTGLGAGGFSLHATLDEQHPLLADGAPATPAAPGGTNGSAPGDQSGRTVSRDKPTPAPKPTPVATPTTAPTPTPPACKWKAASIETTPYGVDVKDDKKLKALQKAASALVSKAAPAAANIVAALPAVYGQVSKNLVEVYITYICVDPAGNVIATRVVHLTDLEALDWSAPDAQNFNSPDRKVDRQKDVMRNTPQPH